MKKKKQNTKVLIESRQRKRTKINALHRNNTKNRQTNKQTNKQKRNSYRQLHKSETL